MCWIIGILAAVGWFLAILFAIASVLADQEIQRYEERERKRTDLEVLRARFPEGPQDGGHAPSAVPSSS